MINDNSNIESFFLMFLKHLCACCTFHKTVMENYSWEQASLRAWGNKVKALSQMLYFTWAEPNSNEQKQ